MKPPVPVAPSPDRPRLRQPVPLQAANSLVASLWVAVCAATPEFIWRGLKSVIADLDVADVVSALLVGLILAFCIEPAMERLRHRWMQRGRHAHPSVQTHEDDAHPYGLIFRAAIGLAFAFASVCLHDAITDVLAAHAADNAARRAGLAAGLNLAGAWTIVPFCITLAWLTIGRGALAWVCGLLAVASPLAAALVFSWNIAEWLTTELPAVAILAWGYRQWPRGPVAGFFRRATRPLLYLCPIAPVLALLLAGLSSLTGLHWLGAYTPEEGWIDGRFYLGWAIGLLLAPVPLTALSHARE
ncbi:hypothetical protein [Acidisoma silvae]|uniref:Uncharacterized protein n=1 Tax=Acidisoma silvae TaxID=2802396 RepID=A0A963YTE7_9PROT|nr:hypothetical protein [Acidisoma silvae]MCB8876670.1 hypothetical protein [Acidisoma silvae]